MIDNNILNKYPKTMKVLFRKDGQDDDYIVFKTPYDGAISIINPVGSRIFELSNGKRTTADIIGYINDEFDVPNEIEVQNDVVNLINYLVECGVLMVLSN